MQHLRTTSILPGLAAVLLGCAAPSYDVVIRHGTVYDGSGGAPFPADVAVKDGKIAAVGVVPAGALAAVEIDAAGKAVAPGFINMLSHSEESLILDGRSQGDLRQGVTLEVFGENSMGPLNDAMKAEAKSFQRDVKYDIPWSTLGGYFAFLEARGISTNVASFVGAGTVREHVLGYARRDPTPAELDAMRALVDQAMTDGAVGLSTALIYPPDTFATTEQLVALAQVAAKRGGVYAAHVRDEGPRLLDAIAEHVRIAREAKIPAEIYHLKVAGKESWGDEGAVIRAIEAARAEGLAITADMYVYTAGETALASAIPPWAVEGGFKKLEERLHDPATRERIRAELDAPAAGWENLFREAGPEGIKLVSFKRADLRPLLGKTLAEIAAARGAAPEDALMDLVVEDESAPMALYFDMSEDNVRRQIALPWMSFCSDAESSAPEGVFLKESAHPRAYGNFARLLGRYVRDEGLVPLQEAIRRLTSLPAANLHLAGRGALTAGAAADVVVFDPRTIQDHATYDAPLQYATGVSDVLVNGVPVIRGGEHTGAKPGRIVHGPGWRAAPTRRP